MRGPKYIPPGHQVSWSLSKEMLEFSPKKKMLEWWIRTILNAVKEFLSEWMSWGNVVSKFKEIVIFVRVCYKCLPDILSSMGLLSTVSITCNVRLRPFRKVLDLSFSFDLTRKRNRHLSRPCGKKGTKNYYPMFPLVLNGASNPIQPIHRVICLV